MKLLFHILLTAYGLLLLDGCSSLQRGTDFQSYTDKFQYEMRVHNRGGVSETNDVSAVSVQFGSVPYLPQLNTEAIAVCKPGSWMERPRISIDRAKWDRLSETEREILIFHEMGHCLLGSVHTATGIMKARLMSAEAYKQERAQLLDNLFGARALGVPRPFESLATLEE